MEEHRPRQRVAGLALVQPGVGPPAQLAAAQPVEREQAPFHAADLPQGHGQPVLPRVGGQPAQHARRGRVAGADRHRQTQCLVPVRPHVVGIDGAADHAGQYLRHGLAAEGVEPAVLEVAQSGRKAEAEQGQQAEHLVGGTPGVGVVLDDAQPGAVLEQPVQHVRRLAGIGGDDLGVEGREAVGDVGVEQESRLI